jgi:hypothetical protein
MPYFPIVHFILLLFYTYSACGVCYLQNRGVRKRCRQSWLTNSALVYEPMQLCGNVEGLCGVSANEYSCAHGAQINFGDKIPYLTDDTVCCYMYFLLGRFTSIIFMYLVQHDHFKAMWLVIITNLVLD